MEQEEKKLKLEELTEQERRNTFESYINDKYQDDLANRNQLQQQELKQEKIEQLEQQFQKEQNRQSKETRPQNSISKSPKSQYNFDVDENDLDLFKDVERQLQIEKNNQDNQLKLEELTKQERQATFKAYTEEKYSTELASLEEQQQEQFKNKQIEKLEEQFALEKTRREMLQTAKSWGKKFSYLINNPVEERKEQLRLLDDYDRETQRLIQLIDRRTEPNQKLLDDWKKFNDEYAKWLEKNRLEKEQQKEKIDAQTKQKQEKLNQDLYQQHQHLQQQVNKANEQLKQTENPITDERLSKLADLVVRYRDRKEKKVAEGNNYKIENLEGNISISAKDGRGEIFSTSSDGYTNRLSEKDYQEFEKIDKFVRDYQSNGQPEEKEQNKLKSQNFNSEESLEDFKHWYYVKRASDDYQMQRGLKTPEDITPSGVNFHQRYLSGGRKNEASHAARNILTNQGLDTDIKHHERLKERIFSQFEDNAQSITNQRYSAWKSQDLDGKVEITVAELKKWQEEAKALNRSKDHLSGIEQLTNKAKKQGLNPNEKIKIDFKDYSNRLDDLAKTNKNNITQKIALEYEQKYKNVRTTTTSKELKEWRKQAEKLGRSQKHLNKIDEVINNALKTQKGKSVEIGLTDKRAMKRDRFEFFLKQLNPNKSQMASQGRKR